MLVFVEGGKPENPEKNPRSKDENQQQTQPTYDVESGNRTRATLEGGECSHHCAIPGKSDKSMKFGTEIAYALPNEIRRGAQVNLLRCSFYGNI